MVVAEAKNVRAKAQADEATRSQAKGEAAAQSKAEEESKEARRAQAKEAASAGTLAENAQGMQAQASSDPRSSDAGTGGHRTAESGHVQKNDNWITRLSSMPLNIASQEQIAMLRRLGLNRVEVMKPLKDLVGSIDPRAPMRVVKYTDFKKLGRIPRSNDKITKKLSEVPHDARAGFVSHRWLRPWHTMEECEANGHVWGGMAHPDDDAGTKHKLICDGIEKLAKAKGWHIDNFYLWIDFAGVEQDDEELLKAGVASLRGYISLCDAVLIPAPSVPEGTDHTVDMVPGGYGDRGWTRLEAMSMYAVSVLKQVEAPEIWVAAGDGASFLERFDYVLKELPSSGVLFSEADREYIRGHETTFMEQMREVVKRNGYITKHCDVVNCVAFDPKDPNGDLVASGGDDGVIKLVNRQTGTTFWSVDVEAEVKSLAFSRDGSMLAAGFGKTVQVWTVTAGSRPVKKGSVRGHTKHNPECTCKHDVGEDGSECPVTGHWEKVRYVAFSPDGSLLASSSGYKTPKLWDLTTKEVKCTLEAHAKNNPKCTCEYYSWGELKMANPECPATGHWEEVSSVAFSPDFKTLAEASWDNTVKLWDLFRGHSGGVICMAWNHDGSLLTSASGKTVKLWDPKTLKQKGTLKGHSREVLSVAWNHDGSLLASAGGRGDNTVRLWDPKTQENKHTMRGHLDSVNCVCWNHGGSLLASASSDKTVKLWDPKTTEEKGTVSGHSDLVRCVAFNHDESLLASASDDQTVRLWTPDGQEKCCLRGHSAKINSVDFSPDSKYVASGSGDIRNIRDPLNDNTVRIWDISTGKEVCCLRGHCARVWSVAWNHDGSLLASWSSDDTVRLWTPDGQEKGILRGATSSWKGLDDRTWRLAAKVKARGPKVMEGGSAGSNRIRQYIVTANSDMVYIHKTGSDGEKQGEPLACFRSPTPVETVICRGTKVGVGCQDGQVSHRQLFDANGAVFF